MDFSLFQQRPLAKGVRFLSVSRLVISFFITIFLLLSFLSSVSFLFSKKSYETGLWEDVGREVPSFRVPAFLSVHAGGTSTAEDNLARRRKAAAAPVSRSSRSRFQTGDAPIADEYSPDYARKVREASGESDVSVASLGYRMGETLPVTVYVRTERRTSHFLSFTSDDDGQVLEMETKKPKWEKSSEEHLEEEEEEEEEDEEEDNDEVDNDLEGEETLNNNRKKHSSRDTSSSKEADRLHEAQMNKEEEKYGNTLTTEVPDHVPEELEFPSSSEEGKKKVEERPTPTVTLPSSQKGTVGDITTLAARKKRRRTRRSRGPISSLPPTTTMIPLSQDSNVEMELRLASSLRQSKNQLVRNIPNALSPRMGVNYQVHIPVLTWMTQAAASMQNDRSGNDKENLETESTLAFRFSVSGHGRKKETTWFPLVSRARCDGFHVEHEARMDYVERAQHKGRSSALGGGGGAEIDSMSEAKQREDGHRSDAESGEACPMRYLSGLTFYFGFRSGVFNTITSLSMKAYYSETLTRELVMQYQWDEHRPYNSHYGITLISICSVISSVAMLYVILGGPPVEDIVRYFSCGLFFRQQRLRRSRNRKAHRVSAKYYEIVEAAHHHED